MSSPIQLCSQQVVTGFPEQRLTYLADRIRARRAHYCAVLQPRTFMLEGLIRFSDVAASPATATRILADLMDPTPLHRMSSDASLENIVDLLVKNDPAEVAVEEPSGAFVGLITPESFIRGLLASKHQSVAMATRLPADSRWHPYPPSQENASLKAG